MSRLGPAQAADRFVEAIVWGEHLRVWELLSATGREHVLEAGSRRGLDPMQAERIRQGTSPQSEFDEFLTGLLHGLRFDFSGVPLDHVRAEEVTAASESEGSGIVQVSLACPANFGEGSWAAGSVTLSLIDDRWLVDRVHPIVSRSE